MTDEKTNKTEQKLDEHKAALKKMTIATARNGSRDGLRADQVQGMLESMFTLGWLPPELRDAVLQ